MSAEPINDVLRQVYNKSRQDPDWFCRNVLQMPNDIWQTEMLQAIADLDREETLYNHEKKNRFTVRAFHGPGKTHFLAKLMHWWNFTRKGRVVATAPKEKQLITRLWPEFRKIRASSLVPYQNLMRVDKTAITWCNDADWCAIAETASVPENLAGYHDDNLLFVIEEASGVAEEIFQVVEGALTTDGAVLVMIGNPTRTEGEFFNSHTKKGTKELYYRKAIQHHETTRINKAWVDGMIAKYGEQSPVVQVRVFGNFVDTEENQLIAIQWMQDAIDRDFAPDGSLPRLRVTVDVADGGEDSSIISVAHHYDSFKYFVKQHKFNFPPAVAPIKTAEAAQRIFEAEMEAGQFYDGDIVVDSVGVGAGTAGALMLAGMPVIRYMGGASSDDPKQWRNRRTQSYLCYRDDLRDGKVIFAPDYYEAQEEDDFLAQHASIKTVPGSERVEDIETKQNLKRRGIKSPDMPDACQMHYATESPTIGMVQTDMISAAPSLAANADW